MNKLVDARRLVAGFVVLAVLMVPLYFVLLRSSETTEIGISNPILLKTPPSASATKVGLEVGQLAPDFEISATDGQRVRLSDFRGRPVVLNFFALWCTSCLTEMPEIKAAQEERGVDTFAVLAVNAGETRERALEFIDFLDAPFTYGLDLNLAVSDAFRVLGLPATVFIDAQGVVQTWYAGYTGKERLNIFLDAAINAQPPGDLPVVLRLISTIPRDRLLTVEPSSESEVKLTSRSLRCDAAYCAESAVEGLMLSAGVSILKADLDGADPTVTLRFDPSIMTRAQLVDAMVQALESIEDPVYQGPVTVTHAGS
jgi:peroxiredoxin